MNINTKAFGRIEVDDRQKVTFPRGLYGFETLKDYVLLDAEQRPFFWLQSIDIQEVAFILIDPFLIRPDYELDINDEELKEIGITTPQNVLVFTTVTVPAEGSPITANLQGPIVINKENHLAIQSILTDPRWKTKHDILAELAMLRNVQC
jgi:flagellar assembly factor FliW